MDSGKGYTDNTLATDFSGISLSLQFGALVSETLHDNKIKLIYIVGVGRSGTSLLQSMLAAHPNTASLPETAFLRRYAATALLQSLYRNHGPQTVIQRLQSDSYFARTQLDARSLVEQSLSNGQLSGKLFYMNMLHAATKNTSGHIVDKDPRAIEFLPLLQAVAPDAQVVHIFRDPRDVLASKKQAAWSRTGHAWKHIFANRVQFRLGRTEGRRRFGENYHEISYEKLISTPESVLSDLCNKLGLDYHPKMLNFGEAAKSLVAADELDWKKQTLGPLLNQNHGKWRVLSNREINLTEACCKEAMRWGRHHSDNRKLKFSDKLWQHAGWLTISIATHPYMLYRNITLARVCKRIK